MPVAASSRSVEGSCVPVTVHGWPYEARRCTYGHGLSVIVADPSPDRVARWIIDAAQRITAVAALRTRDPANWERAWSESHVTR